MGAASANRPRNGRRGKANHRREARADSVAARKPSSSGGTRPLKKSDSFLRQGGQVNVAMASRLFGISRSQYHAEPKRQPSKRQQEDAQLSAKVSEFFHAHKQRYGSPRIHNELKQEGIKTNRKRVIKHMKNNHLRARVFKRWVHTTDSQHGLPKPKKLVNRDFSATAPNQTWLGDVTY